MKRFKEICIKIQKRIKKSNFVQLLKHRAIIKELKQKIGDLEEKEKTLNNEILNLRIEKRELKKTADRVPSLELVILSSDKSIKDKINENNQLKDNNKKLEEKALELDTKLFEKDLELKSSKIQVEEYESQIKDLKSNRYLIRKIPSGRTPNTVKTKVSKPMSARVTKYMREEHE